MAQCKMNNEKCRINEETPLGVSKMHIFLVIPLELHQTADKVSAVFNFI